MFWVRIALAMAVFVVAAAAPANGGLIALNGPAQVVSEPPVSLVRDAVEGGDLSIFAESQGVTLDAPLTLDIGQGGAFESFSNRELGGFSTVVDAGTVVDSFIVHFDPPGSPKQQTSLSGPVTLTFAQPVFGLLVGGSSLRSTDGLLGLAGTSYLNSSHRGLEEGEDSITLSDDLRTLTINSLSGTRRDLDEIRIVSRNTAGQRVVPEPATILLGLAGLVILAARRGAQRRHSPTAPSVPRATTPTSVPR